MKREIRYPPHLLDAAQDRRRYPEKWCPWCGAALVPKIRTNGRIEQTFHYQRRETCNADHSAKLRRWRDRVGTTFFHNAPAEPYPAFSAVEGGDPSIIVQPPSRRRATLFEKLGPKLYDLLREAIEKHSPEILEVWEPDSKLQALDYPDDGAGAFHRVFT